MKTKNNEIKKGCSTCYYGNKYPTQEICKKCLDTWYTSSVDEFINWKQFKKKERS